MVPGKFSKGCQEIIVVVLFDKAIEFAGVFIFGSITGGPGGIE